MTDPVLISSALYLINAIMSILLALTIIHRLYISKKFTKEKDFHLYNDIFSWEMFLILMGIAHIITIITLMMQFPAVISINFVKIIIFLWFSCFWNKIIHLEKMMNKITYENHQKVAGIPCIFIIFVLLFDLPHIVLLNTFLFGALTPYLILVWLLKSNFAGTVRTIKTFIGTVFIGLGCIFLLDLLNSFVESSEIIHILVIIAPILHLLGIFFIFNGIYNELFS